MTDADKFGGCRNPIFGRELMTLLRSNKAFALLGVYLLVSVGVLLLAWPRDASQVLLQGQVSREIFRLFGLGQTLLLAIIVPATLGPSMTTEKERETLDLLLTTPLSGNQILLGKLGSGLTYFVLLVLVSMPVMLMCFVIGGISVTDVVGLYLFLFLQMIVYGLVSLDCSVYFHRTHVSVIISYLIVGVLAAGSSALYGDGIGFLESGRVFIMLLGVFFAPVLYVSALERIRQPFHPVPKSIDEEEESRHRQPLLVIRRDAFPDRWMVPSRSGDLMEDGANPLYEKESQAEIYGHGTLFIRIIIQFSSLVALGVTFFCLSTPLRDPLATHPEYAYFCFLIAYVMIVGPSIAATTFTQEKEQHTIEHLLLTSLPRFRIVQGKFMFIARVVGALAAFNALCFLVIIFLSSFNYSQVLALPLTIAPVVLLTVSLGMFLSLHCRTTLASTISTYFALFALYLGPVLAKVLMTRLLQVPSAVGLLDYVTPFLACYRHGTAQEQLAAIAVSGSIQMALAGAFLVMMIFGFEPTLKRQLEKA